MSVNLTQGSIKRRSHEQDICDCHDKMMQGKGMHWGCQLVGLKPKIQRVEKEGRGKRSKKRVAHGVMHPTSMVVLHKTQFGRLHPILGLLLSQMYTWQ